MFRQYEDVVVEGTPGWIEQAGKKDGEPVDQEEGLYPVNLGNGIRFQKAEIIKRVAELTDKEFLIFLSKSTESDPYAMRLKAIAEKLPEGN